MLDDAIIKLHKDVLKRYEHNLNDGVLFLYHIETHDVWVGNSSSNDLIKCLDGKRSLKEVYSALYSLYGDYNYSVFKNTIMKLLQTLLNKNFLEIVQR